MPEFSHLHVHTQYSLLDGAAHIPTLVKKAKADGQRALAITDHGNMFGVFSFVAEAAKAGIKPIIGCEFYLVKDRHAKQFTKDQPDQRYHQLLLAKNAEGYKNLSRLCSLGYMEGLYSKWPRIDKELIAKHHQGLIATSCCIGAEVPQLIIKGDLAEAETQLKWWLDLFGDDFYIELQRHYDPQAPANPHNQEIKRLQDTVNAKLLDFAKRHDVKIICTNDSHYVDVEDYLAHDILLCVNTGEFQSTPVGDEKGKRFGFPNNQFYFKSAAEMASLFADLPQALDNTGEIADKVDTLDLKRDVMLPNYALPPGFSTQIEYLRHLTLQGAQRRYGSPTAEIEERLNFELEVIGKMGFEGYFLIVQDFIQTGRNLGVWVGPGRGSAAGSAVAYCIGITNIDPLKYSLLFERFLNPERVSMPDIDIDFDDEGRQKVINYVVNKYGEQQGAQIITFGSMAARSSIKDVARVMNLPLADSNYLAKLVPDRPVGVTLKEAIDRVPELKAVYQSEGTQSEVLHLAEKLEGNMRNSGIHAAGVIIAPMPIIDCIPVAKSKESELLVTQWDGRYIESAGMLKMDFLGLKTLSILRDACQLVKERHGVDIDLDNLPLDDPKTFDLYQRGATVATFQFESEGMRKSLSELKPTSIEDLIAMNALFRPGPMDFIPSFIARKHGREPIEYPHPLLEGILKPTYGIMVYQEQIMQTAQIIAGYSLGGADLLRRAMGKKDMAKMAKERERFVAGAGQLHGIDAKKANEVFDVMERFAMYGFNRSHAAAYSLLAFQTAYLKAHYPAEYMAAVLSNAMGTMDKITVFMDECRRMGLSVLGPDVNESGVLFSVNARGDVRFGLGAIKGAGELAVQSIIDERKTGGAYRNIFDFACRTDLRKVTRKTFESLIFAGAFDGFADLHRAQFFQKDADDYIQLEKVLKYAAQKQEAKHQFSLFGGGGDGADVLPKLAEGPRWSIAQKLKHEREVVGFFISGHPLDEYRHEIKDLARGTLADIESLTPEKEMWAAAFISKCSVRKNKRGEDFGVVTLEDYETTLDHQLFSEQFRKFGALLQQDTPVLLRIGMKRSYRNENMNEMVINEVVHLGEAYRSRAQSLTLKIASEAVSERLIFELSRVIGQHPGEKPLKFELQSQADGRTVSLSSHKNRVSVNGDLMQSLRLIPDVEVKVA